VKTILYYYTATGNSLAIARDIAAGLGNAELLPMAAFRSEAFKPDAERVGILFPVYAWGPPRTVREFLSSMDPAGLSYVFAVASSGGDPAGTLGIVRKALRARGGELHAGFALRSELYSGTSDAQAEPFMIKAVRKLSHYEAGPESERLPSIIEAVRRCERSRSEVGALPGRLAGGFFYGLASSVFPGSDKGYSSTEACTGCGTCERVCPRRNVVVESGRPEWKHDCDSCGACLIWCPSKAIVKTGGIVSVGGHRADISLSDMLLR
jgi:ferredoxin/flavodoxin